MWDHLGITVTVAAFIFNVLVTAIGGTWKIAQLDQSLREAIARANKEVDTRIELVDGRVDALRFEIIERIDRQYRDFGETNAAIRQKITEVELFGRDTYMRRDSFYKVQEAIEANIKTIADKIDARLERMENKIDTKT